ncbi:rhomboid-related protein 4 isoform X2 [Erinaceus europaeus]|uniref:Rhomboid-related protein 4 isoform X2 n=1 Tax=Erinaceus europaeus TaxID=9365 RepID=A0ABM3XLJ2_ERIEU|nr:rhomboid-related protein 4 isoform X2 [Erinaceus europaeus]
MQRRTRGVNTGLILLLSQIFHVGVNNIPPVTLATLALNIWLFLNPLKPLYDSCLSVDNCYHKKDWQRLLLSPLHHADDWHLYFNMASLLWKGISLERRLGSKWFAYLITTFSLLTGVVYLILEFALAEFMNDPDFKRSCAVGFSGVLFALKVLNNHYCPGGCVNVLGFPVPNKYACWAELVAIHFFSPGTSFAGHLAGILVGLMYVHGPLKKIMEACSGYAGYQDYYPNGGPTYHEDVPRNYDAYTAGLSEEEQLERALRASLHDRGKKKFQKQPPTLRVPALPRGGDEETATSQIRQPVRRCGSLGMCSPAVCSQPVWFTPPALLSLKPKQSPHLWPMLLLSTWVVTPGTPVSLDPPPAGELIWKPGLWTTTHSFLGAAPLLTSRGQFSHLRPSFHSLFSLSLETQCSEDWHLC